MFVNKIYFNDIVNAKLICIINTYISLSMSNGKLLKKKTPANSNQHCFVTMFWLLFLHVKVFFELHLTVLLWFG